MTRSILLSVEVTRFVGMKNFFIRKKTNHCIFGFSFKGSGLIPTPIPQSILILVPEGLPRIRVALIKFIYQNIFLQALGSIRQEMILLSAVVKQMDSCWESRLRTLIKLFIQAARYNLDTSSAVVQVRKLVNLSVPCRTSFLLINSYVLNNYKII